MSILCLNQKEEMYRHRIFGQREKCDQSQFCDSLKQMNGKLVRVFHEQNKSMERFLLIPTVWLQKMGIVEVLYSAGGLGSICVNMALILMSKYFFRLKSRMSLLMFVGA
ncbi:hypothetical protein QN372_13855 [Undibacterium sp. RTI2.1]|uniref:hypothetical protein n=1 Tax=unclassified Undibacterium TaxID=2630295 RepID=UPI002AB47A5A|nr:MULTISPECIES: hypothetical protein [unclassified Undibacterium]MDY7537267.1 hypothetical protein [Undibacterium sp. 5I1]MEB0031840.1 hypothetical protein [Undibacterium sp. RTI2.1]MEB0117550.1 hypothetical protein [Undibacterium sp. RTI2.2]MEB0230320.1 hypothetical protein [Undibacterium sp. 10I3]MEB0258170.1 hypothetical protein [Undibacterium sp. 5I1]